MSKSTQFKKGHSTPLEWRLKIAEAARRFHTGRKAEKSWVWKGDNVKYGAKHKRIREKYGKACKCENCHTKESVRFEWANLDKKYSGDIKTWAQLCSSCHIKHDRYKHKLYLVNKVGINVEDSMFVHEVNNNE